MVAYKQPVSRARVSAIRGVNVDGVMRTLLTRGLVEEAGQDESSGAHLFRTSSYFLERIGVDPDRRAARAGAVPPRPGRPRGRAGGSGGPAPTPRRPSRGPAPSPTAAPSPRDRPGLDDDGLIRLQKLLAQSGVASRRKCEELMLAGEVEVDGEVVTRLGTKVDPRTAVIRVDGQAAAAGLAARLPGAQQAARRGLDDVRPRGPPDPGRPGRRPSRAALPRRPPRHRHLRADRAHQRRRLRAADRAPVVRGGQDLRRRGRRRGHQGHAAAAARTASPSTTARSPCRGPGSCSTAPARRSSSWSSTRAATGSSAGCSTTSATRSPGSPAPGIGPVQLGQLKSGELRELTLDELGVLLDRAEL